MIAYHGQQEIKDKYLERVRAHREADQLVKGTYWERGKGCAVGCTIHSDDHSAYERELGIPMALARIEDGIFEGLPNGEAQAWPERFLAAIRPGADLGKVKAQFLIWLLMDEAHGVIRFAKPDGAKAIQAVAELYRRELEGEAISVMEWHSAAAAAYAAAAANAAANAYAAANAAYAAANAAGESKARLAQADKLIELLSAA